MTDIRDVDPAELAYAEGGSAYVRDDYCGTAVPFRPGWPPVPFWGVSTASPYVYGSTPVLHGAVETRS